MSEPHKHSIRDSFFEFTTSIKHSILPVKNAKENQREITPADLEPLSIRSGWLYKRGGGNKSSAWKKRWCVLLTSGEFYWFGSLKDKKCKGMLQTQQYWAEDSEDGPHGFKLTPRTIDTQQLNPESTQQSQTSTPQTSQIQPQFPKGRATSPTPSRTNLKSDYEKSNAESSNTQQQQQPIEPTRSATSPNPRTLNTTKETTPQTTTPTTPANPNDVQTPLVRVYKFKAEGDSARKDWMISFSHLYELEQEEQKKSKEQKALAKLTPAWEISQKDVLIEKEIARGEFGIVYYAKYLGQEVAVKQLIGKKGDERERAIFVRECEVIMKLRPHANVISFRGFCLDPLSIVTKHYSQGNLEKYLRSAEASSFPFSRRIELAKGIAMGLAHLHSEKIVHRDMAARNVLLTDLMEPVVSDFGFARSTNTNERTRTYFNLAPIRWMSFEALFHDAFSDKSDVWGFGVTFFEILNSPYQEPYKDLLPRAIPGAIREGRRLEPPQETPSDVKQLLTSCWMEKPEDRPSMDSIVDNLQRLSFSLTSLPTSVSAPALLGIVKQSQQANEETQTQSTQNPTLRTTRSETSIQQVTETTEQS